MRDIDQQLAILEALAEGPDPRAAKAQRAAAVIRAESDRANAFAARDEQILPACAQRLLWLWSSNG
jgi:hypothetical protein